MVWNSLTCGRRDEPDRRGGSALKPELECAFEARERRDSGFEGRDPGGLVRGAGIDAGAANLALIDDHRETPAFGKLVQPGVGNLFHGAVDEDDVERRLRGCTALEGSGNDFDAIGPHPG